MNAFTPSARGQTWYLTAALLGCLLAWTWTAQAAERTPKATLSLQDYLSQVKDQNTGYRGSVSSSQGAELRAHEADLHTAPTAFVNYQYSHDGRPPQIPLFVYDFQDTHTVSVGVSKQTLFGLQAKLYYNLLTLNFVNPRSPLLSALSPAAATSLSGGSNSLGSYITSTNLELTQSIWANGFGRGTTAQHEALEAQAMSSHHQARYQARGALVRAESAYWRLVAARQAVRVQREALERAKKNYDWSERRARLQLGDRSDAFQSQAALELRRLELQGSIDEEATAARAFNSSRGVDSNAVDESLPELSQDSLRHAEAPKRAQLRDDVKSASEQTRAAVAGATVALERDRPTLDVFGNLSMNGNNSSLETSFSQSASFTYPAAAVGLRFSAPIDIPVLQNSREGYRREAAGAEATYQRKLFEQETEWKDLLDRLTQAKNRMELALGVENLQERKISHERERLRSGRSTTYQVLVFEQDFALAQLGRIRAQSEVLAVLSQMKLYGEEL